jgi:RNA polymerase sigma-70 factor (ECF subfamily)
VLDAFLTVTPARLREAWQSFPALVAELEHARADAAQRWPELEGTVDAETFASYLGARVEDEPVAGERAFPHAAELYLACAITQGNASALRAFERAYTPSIASAVGRFRLSTHELDELTQSLRLQLLAAEPNRLGRIADYSGRGELSAWLRVAAVRAAIKMKRTPGGTRVEDDALEGIASDEPSPELRYASEQHRAAFRNALRQAIASLEPEEQNVLRQHHLDGLTLDQLSALHRVHRTTVAYWLDRARQRLFKRTRQALVQKMSASDCDSLFRHAQSHLAVTLRTLFNE